MKAVVLAGGFATRMWPITRHRPKMFLPVGERTVIDGIFEELEADDRIEEVYVSTNEAFADAFEAYLEAAPFEKPILSIEETEAEDEKFGVIGALEQLVRRENVDDDLLVVAGDNLISFDIAEFLDFFETKGTPVIAAYDVGSRERAKSYGLVELDGDLVVDFQEKPDEPNSTMVSIACYAYPQATLPLLNQYLQDGNNPDEPGWFVQWLQARGDVHAYTFDGAWFDIGTAESYLDAVAWRLDGGTLVHEDASVENSDLGENVHVMADATVRNSTLERSIVFPEATIADANVRGSVVDEGTRIEGLDISDALIGAHTRILNS